MFERDLFALLRAALLPLARIADDRLDAIALCGVDREVDGLLSLPLRARDLVAGVTASTSFRPVGDLPALMPNLETRLKHVVAAVRRRCQASQGRQIAH